MLIKAHEKLSKNDLMKKFFFTVLKIFWSKLFPKQWICGVLRDFVPFVQFEKYEKHLWRSK